MGSHSASKTRVNALMAQPILRLQPVWQKSLLCRVRAMLKQLHAEETTMRTWLLIALCCVLPPAAVAQTYPSKTITLIVPAPPAGVTDVLARTLAQRFTAAWGQQAIVENRPGGNNQIAAEYVTKAPPDGHTLMIGPEVTFIANPALYGRLNYDPINGFTPIVGLVIINHALIAHPSLPVNSVAELIDLGRRKPGEINYGTYGAGSTGHLNMEALQAVSGAKFTAVHYRGAAPA